MAAIMRDGRAAGKLHKQKGRAGSGGLFGEDVQEKPSIGPPVYPETVL